MDIINQTANMADSDATKINSQELGKLFLAMPRYEAYED